MPFASNTSHQVEALKLVILTGLRPFFVHVFAVHTSKYRLHAVRV